MIKVNFCLPRSVRVKLNTKCQLKCKFCHQEGHSGTKEINIKNLLAALLFLKKEMGFYRVHFTGGEPTLYNDFSKLLKKIKSIGFTNALTTNGQFCSAELKKLKRNGLDSINFSLHTLNPYIFLSIQNVNMGAKKGIEWAEKCIKKTIQNVLFANKIIDTKINCVVSKNSIGPKEILEFCIRNNIKLRLLNDLNEGEFSLNKIREVLYRKRAELIGHEITFLSSSHRLDYTIGNYRFGVKCIRPFFLKTLCRRCNFKNTPKCLEGFYGIRLEDNPLMVRLCLNKNNSPYVQKFEKFIKSSQFLEIKKDMTNIIKYIKNDSIIKEQQERFK